MHKKETVISVKEKEVSTKSKKKMEIFKAISTNQPKKMDDNEEECEEEKEIDDDNEDGNDSEFSEFTPFKKLTKIPPIVNENENVIVASDVSINLFLIHFH